MVNTNNKDGINIAGYELANKYRIRSLFGGDFNLAVVLIWRFFICLPNLIWRKAVAGMHINNANTVI